MEVELAEALPEPAHAAMTNPLRWALRLAPVVLLAVAVWVLWREFHKLSLTAVAQAMDGWGHPAIAGALPARGVRARCRSYPSLHSTKRGATRGRRRRRRSSASAKACATAWGRLRC